MFVYFYVYVMCMFCIVFNLCANPDITVMVDWTLKINYLMCAKFELVKSPEITLSG